MFHPAATFSMVCVRFWRHFAVTLALSIQIKPDLASCICLTFICFLGVTLCKKGQAEQQGEYLDISIGFKSSQDASLASNGTGRNGIKYNLGASDVILSKMVQTDGSWEEMHTG